MRIGALDERRGLEDLDVVIVEATEHNDLVIGTNRDAKDARVVKGGGVEEEVVVEEEAEREDIGGQ